MSKEVNKLTITDLIKNKEKFQVKDDVKDELFIERLGASITIRKPERSLCLEAFDYNDGNYEENGDDYLVYNIVVDPNLKDEQLRKEFNCTQPIDIVRKVFESGEITKIAQLGLGLAGYDNSIKRVKDLKN